MDATGCMWQIVIEGSKVKVVNSTPVQVCIVIFSSLIVIFSNLTVIFSNLLCLQTYLNGPTCVAWKNDLMTAGDSEGILFFQDKVNNSRF